MYKGSPVQGELKINYNIRREEKKISWKDRFLEDQEMSQDIELVLHLKCLLIIQSSQSSCPISEHCCDFCVEF